MPRLSVDPLDSFINIAAHRYDNRRSHIVRKLIAWVDHHAGGSYTAIDLDDSAVLINALPRPSLTCFKVNATSCCLLAAPSLINTSSVVMWWKLPLAFLPCRG